MVGPRLQRDIFEIIAKWRKWQFVLAADVEKMYRQTKISKEDQEYQHVLWREQPSHPIKERKLTTVTYGIASAQFLVVRALQEMARDSKPNYRIQELIKNDFCIDDLLTGGDSIERIYKITYKNMGFTLKNGLPTIKR
ncbi:uncharacterized protein LOC119675444 [Teleopsis dalmanni]|uniref:uncharacterized protein LOC119675444 n=1 Tax=Teleopsis dalmanni TaxID=139649 RepID=UPI0018CD3936|nr:uncharacterized protein LOC119675444 [Teleopsis dalmanni]